MKISLLPLIFAFTCTSLSAQTLATSGKKFSQNNPISPLYFCADPTAVEYEGRVYVYGTHDHQEFLEYTPYSTSNSYGKINQLVCMSSSDMLNWTWHEPIDVKAVAPWTGCSWAPSICSKTDADGVTHFYLYFANGASGIGVLTSESPTGPWRDPLGKALVAPGQDKLGGIVWLFDPGVCVDDNGVGWLAYGGGDKPNSVGNDLIDGNTRLAKLTDDMIHFDGDPIVLPAPFHFEASEMNFIGGKYVYSYCANWGPKRELWSDFEYYDHSKAKPEAPYAAQMCYMVSTDPLNAESWQYVGNYLDHPGGNNHTHIQKFEGDYYIFHHSEMLSRALNNNDGKGYRSISVNDIKVNEEECIISKLNRNNIENGTSAIRNKRLKTTDLQQAECIWNAGGVEMIYDDIRKVGKIVAVRAKDAGSWFATGRTTSSEEVKSFQAKMRGTGKLEIRLDEIDSEPVGTVEFDSNSFSDYAITLDKPFKGTHNLFFIFTEATGKRNDIDQWQFFKTDINSISFAEADKAIVKTEYYNLAGQKCEKPSSGIFIVRKTFSDGTSVSGKKVF